MDEGVYFVVKEVQIDYKAPARYGDVLFIDTIARETGRTYIVFEHTVRRESPPGVLAGARVKIVAVNSDLRPIRLPEEIKEILY